MNQKYDAVVSLGCRCDTAFQIRDYFNQERAYFFDWLISPLHSVIDLISNDFQDSCQEKNLKIVPALNSGPRHETVIDEKYGYALHHEFQRDSDGRIASDLKDSSALVISKMRALAGRVQDILDSNQRVLFVRRGGDFTLPGEVPCEADPTWALKLHAALTARAPELDFDLLVMNMPFPNDVDLPANLFIGNVHPPLKGEWPDGDNNWKGSTVSYRSNFDSVVESGYAKAN